MLSPRFHQHWPVAAVFVVAFASTAQLFSLHTEHFRERWVGAGHDRNAHYRYGLQMAADLENGELLRFVQDFDSGSWVWPPLNGLLVAAVAILSGRDPVAAAMPSLMGWFLTVVFAYLLAERVSKHYGIYAGFLAVACVLVSPAHRAYATDVMMESLGAGLTLTVLYTFVVWSQERTRESAAWFGWTATLLFFLKYNYWLLVVLAVLPVHAVGYAAEYRALLRRLRREVSWGPWVRSQFRRPLNYPIVALGAVIVALAFTGGFTFDWNGKPVKVVSNQIFVAVAYAFLLLRFTIWWWTGGRSLVRARLPVPVYPLIYWHVFPLLIWFVIPYRLRTFLWFVSPANTEGEYHATFAEGVRFFWDGAAGEYVAQPEVLPVLAVGVILAVLSGPRLRTAGWVVPLFAILALLLICRHPNHKLRFLHTGLVGVDVAAAIGYAAALGAIPRSRPAMAGSIAALLLATAALLGTGFKILGTSGQASEAGLNGQGMSLRRLTDAVAPLIRQDEPTAIFSNVPSKFWAKWMYLERFRGSDQLQVDCRQVSVLGPPTAEEFAAWCARTDCRSVIFVNVAPESSLYEVAPPGETSASVLGLLPGSPFRLAFTIRRSDIGTITIWRR